MRRSGLHDAAPVMHEPFKQWAIEDRFAAGRPAWERVGAQLVADVAPFEAMKLRLLNGSHSALAYLGFLAGHEFIYQVVGGPGVRRATCAGMMGDEVAPDASTCRRASTSRAYQDALVQRFGNPALPHRTQQIAMDGSQKLPQRLLGTVRDNLAAGRPIDLLALAVAGWMRYVGGVDERGREITVADPLAGEFERIAAGASRRSRGIGPRACWEFARSSATTCPPTSAWSAKLIALARRAVRRRRAADGRGGGRRSRLTIAANERILRLGTTMIPLTLHPDRLFSPEPRQRDLARALYATVKDLPIVSPHGHTDPQWFADNEPFSERVGAVHHAGPLRVPHALQPGRARSRIWRSRGATAGRSKQDARQIWRTFAANYHLFRGTPTRIWLDHAFHQVFGIRERLTPESADRVFDSHQRVPRQARVPAARAVRAIQHRGDRDDRVAARSAGASREDPRQRLEGTRRHRVSPRSGRRSRVRRLRRQRRARWASLPAKTRRRWNGYLAAHRKRRAFFKTMGATSTDHGHPTAQTSDLPAGDCERLFRKALDGTTTPAEAEMFRGQMLTEMARMSLDDGLVMQIHPGSFRNHNPLVFARFGRDKGADIPTRTDYVRALKPLLDRFGNERKLTVILFTLDETSYARELAPLAGHYPVLQLGPSWWFHDSPEGMLRFREQTTETAGFYNTVGFNDDTRAFLSIPARHDVARRIDCRFLAQLVAEHRIDEDEAFELAPELAYGLAKTGLQTLEAPGAARISGRICQPNAPMRRQT